MSTARLLLRDRAITALAGIAGWRVHKPPGRTLQAAEVPALIVSVGAGGARPVERLGGGRALFERTPQLILTAVLLDAGGADDAIEALWGEVEIRLAADWTFGGLVKNVTGFSLGPKQDESSLVAQPALQQSLILDAVLYARFGEPATPI